jgi:hypothetical protein
LRVIPYFCSARGADENRPNYETAIRSLIYKLSWMSGLSVAQPTIEFYHQWNGPGKETPSIKRWEELLENLLTQSPKSAILVDGLDAFLTIEDGERFLRRMRAIIAKFPQVYFLCSSHRHIHVDEIFGNELDERRVLPENTKTDMNNFINKEVVAVETEQGRRSIFCKLCIHL